MGEEVGDLKSAFSETVGYPDVEINSLSDYISIEGTINGNNQWANINSNYKHKYIEVMRTGGTLKIKGNTKATYLAFVKSYSTPVNNQLLNYSEATGFTGRITLAANTEKTYTIPNDVKGIVIVVLQGSDGDVSPVMFNLLIPENPGTLMLDVNDIKERVATLEQDNSKYNRTGFDGLTEEQGSMSVQGTWNNINSKYTHYVIPVVGGMVLNATSQVSRESYIAGLKSYTTPVNGATIDYSNTEGWTSFFTVTANNSVSKIVPDDVKFIVVMKLRN